LDQLESEGKWKRIHQSTFMRGTKGMIDMFAELESVLLVYQKAV
jgi:hypothetical protein